MEIRGREGQRGEEWKGTERWMEGLLPCLKGDSGEKWGRVQKTGSSKFCVGEKKQLLIHHNWAYQYINYIHQRHSDYFTDSFTVIAKWEYIIT